MSGCADAAYDKYMVDRGLSSRIGPEDTTFDDPIVPGLDWENEDSKQSTDSEENNDQDEDN